MTSSQPIEMARPESAVIPPFAPRPPWIGGDLQTLRNFLRALTAGADTRLAGFGVRRAEIDLSDGSGDRLAVSVNLPTSLSESPPCMILLHGLAGCETSHYMVDSTLNALAAGFVTVRVNLRGGGPSGPLCRSHYHAGRTEDLESALNDIRALVEDFGGQPVRRLFAVGFSLGANMLLKYLGEKGTDAPFSAAAAISPPLSLLESAKRILAPRNAIYQKYMLENMRKEVLAEPCDLSPAHREAALAARSILEFDDKVVAPRNGFVDALDYYARCSAEGFLGGIEVPTLVVHAEDDPWIPTDAFCRVDWRSLPNLRLALTRSGGHVGFHGRDAKTAWHNLAIASFFDQCGRDLAA